jgi:hypothetical protein
MLPLPPVIAYTLAAIGAAALTKVLAREWRRVVNAELDAQELDARKQARGESGGEPAPGERVATLRRDSSGVYRPE